MARIMTSATSVLNDVLYLFLLIILSPLNLLYVYIQMCSEMGLETTPEHHRKSVGDIQRQVKLWIGRRKEDKGQKMATARPAWKSISLTKVNKSKYFRVAVNLNGIIKLDEDKMVK